MNKQNRNGSALVVVMAVVILVLLGALGFVFWQNVTKKSDNQGSTETNTSQNTTDSVTLKEASIDSGFPVLITWKYPDSWSLTKKGNGPSSTSDSASETFTLTSPSKAYSVIYEVTQNLGFGGMCEPTTPSTIQYVNRYDTPNFPEAVLVESIISEYSSLNEKYTLSGYKYSLALMKNNSSVKNAKLGDSQCGVDSIHQAIELASTPSEYLMKAEIRLNNVDQLDKYGDVLPVKDIQVIKDQFANSEYKDAINILTSTKPIEQ